MPKKKPKSYEFFEFWCFPVFWNQILCSIPLVVTANVPVIVVKAIFLSLFCFKIPKFKCMTYKNSLFGQKAQFSSNNGIFQGFGPNEKALMSTFCWGVWSTSGAKPIETIRTKMETARRSSVCEWKEKPQLIQFEQAVFCCLFFVLCFCSLQFWWHFPKYSFWRRISRSLYDQREQIFHSYRRKSQRIGGVFRAKKITKIIRQQSFFGRNFWLWVSSYCFYRLSSRTKCK